jgi:D-arabinose 1-dehydrogenase-like Zn-dependent alcohol dehydrogenase
LSYPESSRAAVVREFGEPLSVEQVPIPQELEPNALLVEIEVSSICGTDVHLWQGSLSLKVDLPVILGHEMVGRIVAMGAGAERDSIGQRLGIGDRVVWAHSDCGKCYFCTISKQPTLCLNRRQYMYESMEKPPYLMGGFAQHGYVLPGSGRVRVPDDVASTLASLSSCAFRSVINAVDQIGAISATDTIVIQGTGPLGILATGVCKVAGAKRIIAIGAPSSRLQLAKEFGADQTISIEEHSDPENRTQIVIEETAGLGADVVFEFSGHPAAFAEGLDIVRKGGRYMIVGQLGTGSVKVQPSLITKKNLSVLGSFSGDASHYWKALLFIDEHQTRLPFHKLLTNEYGLEEVTVALRQMQSFQEIKPLVYPWN